MDFLFPSLYGGSTFSGVPPMAPMARRPPVEPRSLVGSSGRRALLDRGGPWWTGEDRGLDRGASASWPATTGS